MTSQGRADIKGANRYSRSEVDIEMKFQMDSLNMCLSSISDSEEVSGEKKELLQKQEATNPWHKLEIDNSLLLLLHKFLFVSVSIALIYHLNNDLQSIYFSKVLHTCL